MSPSGLWSTTQSPLTSLWSKPGLEVNKREDEEEEEGVPRTKATKQLRTKRSRPVCPSVTYRSLCANVPVTPNLREADETKGRVSKWRRPVKLDPHSALVSLAAHFPNRPERREKPLEILYFNLRRKRV